MPNRMAASLAMIAFALCLVVGMQAGNTFTTTVTRALVALVGTFVIGLILGSMGQKMIEENLKQQQKKSENSDANPAIDR